MAESFVGEIRMFAGNFAPAGWAPCNGQELPISEYETLFALIGTTYGGDGQSTFALPNLSGRVPLHTDPADPLGSNGGVEAVTLTSSQLPVHTHPFMASTAAGSAPSPVGAAPASLGGASLYVSAPAGEALNAASVARDPGGGQPHDNLQPYLCVTFIISLYGIFPSQN